MLNQSGWLPIWHVYLPTGPYFYWDILQYSCIQKWASFMIITLSISTSVHYFLTSILLQQKEKKCTQNVTAGVKLKELLFAFCQAANAL